MKERSLEDQYPLKGDTSPPYFFYSKTWTEDLQSLTKNGGYKNFFSLLPEGISIFDKDGYCVACNKKMLSLYGYDLFQEIQGTHITAFINTHTLPSAENESKYFAKENSHYESEESIIRRDGKICVIHRNAYPLRDQDGVFLGTLLYERDITAYKEISNEFHKLYRAVDQSANAIIITD